MASRTPPPKPPADKVRENGHDARLFPSTHLRVRRLVGRIADALEVPTGALYEPPASDKVTSGIDTSDVATRALDQECEALLHAYKRIRDPRKRQRMLALVEEVAEQG